MSSIIEDDIRDRDPVVRARWMHCSYALSHQLLSPPRKELLRQAMLRVPCTTRRNSDGRLDDAPRDPAPPPVRPAPDTVEAVPAAQSDSPIKNGAIEEAEVRDEFAQRDEPGHSLAAPSQTRDATAVGGAKEKRGEHEGRAYLPALLAPTARGRDGPVMCANPEARDELHPCHPRDLPLDGMDDSEKDPDEDEVACIRENLTDARRELLSTGAIFEEICAWQHGETAKAPQERPSAILEASDAYDAECAAFGPMDAHPMRPAAEAAPPRTRS